MDPSIARELWLVAEPFHAVTYFAPEVRGGLAAIGMKGFWMGYFAARAAPLGPVGPSVVEAMFYNFHPDRVRRAIPEAWKFAAPAGALAARDAAVDAALFRLVGDVAADLADAARRVADALPLHGRPLFAAHADLPWSDSPRLRLWQATTRLREHRGDGHVATLTFEGVGPCEAHVLAVARGVTDAKLQRDARQWSENDCATATEALRQRGLVTAGGAFTDVGRAFAAHIEDRTDALAASGLALTASEDVGRVLGGLRQLAPKVLKEIPFPNPIGLPQPSGC